MITEAGLTVFNYMLLVRFVIYKHLITGTVEGSYNKASITLQTKHHQKKTKIKILTECKWFGQKTAKCWNDLITNYKEQNVSQPRNCIFPSVDKSLTSVSGGQAAAASPCTGCPPAAGSGENLASPGCHSNGTWSCLWRTEKSQKPVRKSLAISVITIITLHQSLSSTYKHNHIHHFLKSYVITVISILLPGAEAPRP